MSEDTLKRVQTCYPSKEDIENAASKLEEGQTWFVQDPLSAEAAVMASTSRSPASMEITYRINPPTIFSPELLTKIFDNTKEEVRVCLLCLDSFYNVKKVQEKDEERVHACLRGKKCHFWEYFGELDEESIKKIPDTLCSLGLPLRSGEDYKILNSIKKFELRGLDVAVNIDIPLEELKPLPDAGDLSIHVYGLQDKDLPKLRPVIDALLRSRPMRGLCFPGCDLAASEAKKLPDILSGVKITEIQFDFKKFEVSDDFESELREDFEEKVTNSMGELVEVLFDMYDFLQKFPIF